MKVVVVMKNWLGDLLFQMPALDLIKARHPDASIVCVAPERCREILEAHPAVSEFLSFDEKGAHRSWISRMRFALKLKRRGPWDLGFLFHRSRSRAAMLWFAGVRERIGYGKGRRVFLTKAVREPSGKLHQLDYFMELMKGAGYEIPEKPVYRFYYKPDDETQAVKILLQQGISVRAPSLRPLPLLGGEDKGGVETVSRYICFHLGANWEPKRWPAEHFAELAAKIHAKWGMPIVVTGSAQDRPLFDEFEKGVSCRFPKKGSVTFFEKTKKVTDPTFIVDLVGKTPLRVSSVIYKNAACLVTGDSGPMHIAAGVGARVVAIFGPTDPELTGPRGTGDAIVLQYVPPGYSVPFFPPKRSGNLFSRTYGKELPEDGWLLHITPDQVLEAIERILPR